MPVAFDGRASEVRFINDIKNRIKKTVEGKKIELKLDGRAKPKGIRPPCPFRVESRIAGFLESSSFLSLFNTLSAGNEKVTAAET